MARASLLLLALALTAPVAFAESQTYVAAGCLESFFGFCPFDIPLGAETVTIWVEDASGIDPCFSVQWRYADGSLQSGTIRGIGVETYEIPDGAVQVQIWMGHLRIINCAAVQGVAAVPTTGTVNVEWG